MENNDHQKAREAEQPPEDFLDDYAQHYSKEKMDLFYEYFDKFFQAFLGKATAGISPASIQTDIYAWLSQLAQSPGHLMKLFSYPALNAHEILNDQFSSYEHSKARKDARFQSDNWQYLPWRLLAQSFVEMNQWWDEASEATPGLPSHAQRSVAFMGRQLLDAMAPSNFVLTNPDLFFETIRSGGFNLVEGTELAIEHSLRRFTGAPPPGADHFIPGKQVAVTPGKVVYQNHLIELIQYKAQTKTVYKEPVLIIPAWIMKYYILDLSPENSLVNYLVSKGHTVFMISWRNPDSEDRNLGMDDYYRLGAMGAIDSISERLPGQKINLMGYCLGGTLATITAATMAKERDNRLNSLTLLAAQADFSEAGELMLFINDSQLTFLENIMWQQGYLDTKQMAGAFQMLRSYDMIWSKMVQDYMHGRQSGMIDLLAWNADTTRMPYKMHSEYLEKLFLKNQLTKGQFSIEGKHIAVENIRLPAFVVSTEKDHVAPWKSVYKLHLMLSGSICFVLTNGGHNAGIVSEPGHKRRYYRIHEQLPEESYLMPEEWVEQAELNQGSWWPQLHEWLVKKGTKKREAAPALDLDLTDAPGTYVFQK